MKRSGNIQRKAPLRSSGPPERRTRVKPRNAARRVSEFARCYHSKERVAWFKGTECVACSILGERQTSASENAHVLGNDGAGRKGDYTGIVPLCRKHHRAFDEHRVPMDLPMMRDSLRYWAPRYHAAWSAHLHQQTGAGTSGSASVAPSEGTAETETT